MIHIEACNRLRNEADVVLCLGSQLGETDWWGKPPYWAPPARQKLVQVDVDDARLGRNRPADLAILADAKRFLVALLAQLEGARARGCARRAPPSRGGARARPGREPREARRAARESRRADADRARPRRLPPRLRRRRRDGLRRRQHRRVGKLLQRDARAQHAALDPSLRPSRRRRGPGPRRRRRSPGASGLLRDRRRCDGLQHAGDRDRRAPRPARRLPGLLRPPVGHGEDQPDGGARARPRALRSTRSGPITPARSTPISARSPGTASRRRWARTASASPIPRSSSPRCDAAWRRDAARSCTWTSTRRRTCWRRGSSTSRTCTRSPREREPGRASERPSEAPHRRVLVTGAGGFVGSQLVAALARDRRALETIVASDVRPAVRAARGSRVRAGRRPSSRMRSASSVVATASTSSCTSRPS